MKVMSRKAFAIVGVFLRALAVFAYQYRSDLLLIPLLAFVVVFSAAKVSLLFNLPAHVPVDLFLSYPAAESGHGGKKRRVQLRCWLPPA